MIRSAFNVASCLSLLLGCAIAAAWAGDAARPAFEFGYKRQVWQVVSDGGRLRIDNEPQQLVESKPGQWLQCRRVELIERSQRASWSITTHLIAQLEQSGRGESPTPLPDALAQFDPEAQSRAIDNTERMQSKQLAIPKVSLMQWSASLASFMAGTALPPALLLAAHGFALLRRHSRRRCGQCEWCGYDLRGSPFRRCSECGREHGKVSRIDPASGDGAVRRAAACQLLQQPSLKVSSGCATHGDNRSAGDP
jgi:hypothetical protein